MTALHEALAGTAAPAALRAYTPGTAPTGLVPQQRTATAAAPATHAEAPAPEVVEQSPVDLAWS
ncbi:hypothetical protein ACFS33_19320 [Cellulomonas phragmiteti]